MPMIRTLIVDHHPALRAGVKVVLEAERDMVVVGDTGAQNELLPLLRRTRPDVVLLDCHPPKVGGLHACRLIKCLVPAPRVLIYSAYTDGCLRVAARVAGADGLLNKNSSALDLVQAIRVIHRGRQLLEPIRPGDVLHAMRSLDRQEAQILGMLLDDMPPSEIAVALSMSLASVGRRVDDILGRLCAEPPWTSADIPCDRPAA
jgi:two-component system, NarL family, response regulator DevR